MADGVLLVAVHLREAAAVAVFGQKHRVITESGASAAFQGYIAPCFALEAMYIARSINARYYRTEPCVSRLHAFHALKQKAHVCLRVTGLAGKARRMNSRSTVQRIYFKTGIVGKTWQPVSLVNPQSLTTGIFVQRKPILRDILCAV